MVEKNKSTMGKKSRAAGGRFELKVRKDLEEKGWIVDKWSNNVSDYPDSNINKPSEEREDRRLIKVKNKFLGPGKPMMLGAGFPDFIVFRTAIDVRGQTGHYYEVIGVESKINGILDKEEKEKCKWLLENNIFSKILIAKKGEKRGEIKYEEFKQGK